MLDGTCKFKAYEATDIRKGNRDTSAMGFLQDAVLAPVIFIGTLVTIALIVSGLLYVFSGSRKFAQEQSKKRNYLFYSRACGSNAILGYYQICAVFGEMRKLRTKENILSST